MDVNYDFNTLQLDNPTTQIPMYVEKGIKVVWKDELDVLTGKWGKGALYITKQPANTMVEEIPVTNDDNNTTIESNITNIPMRGDLAEAFNSMGRKSYCRWVARNRADEIKSRAHNGETNVDIAKDFKISDSTIGRIVNGTHRCTRRSRKVK